MYNDYVVVNHLVDYGTIKFEWQGYLLFIATVSLIASLLAFITVTIAKKIFKKI
ncbi:MAG: hypothetical protein FWC89_02415 [Defluviitaleaceae bacterium]|nr:hypothetical protein [Defluviitaleaceae bacterium]